MPADRVLVIGATSAIARAFSLRQAADGASLFLAARNAESLAGLSEECRRRGANVVTTRAFRAEAMPEHPSLVEEAFRQLGGFDVVLLAHGRLPDQHDCEEDPLAVADVMAVNATSVMVLALLVATRLERQGSGTLAVISSVAADRGRRSNYVYGASKACLDTFCEGLRARLGRAGAAVLTIKPGLVRSPMTEHLPDSRLFADADRVGERIHAAVAQGRDVVYVPGYWRMVMLGIRALPGRVLDRMNI